MIDIESFAWGAVMVAVVAGLVWGLWGIHSLDKKMREANEELEKAMERSEIRYEVRDFLKNELQAHVDEFHKKKEFERL